MDSTTLEANAAIKSIVRKDTGENSQAYLTTLMREVAVLGTFSEHTTYRPYLAEPQLPAGQQRVWTNKPDGQQQAFYANRRRVRSSRGRRLQRQRSERVERTFAHVCETGGAHRTWLRGINKVRKRYLITAAAHNLSCLMRKLFGRGTPRGLQGAAGLIAALVRALQQAQIPLLNSLQLRVTTPNHRPPLSTDTFTRWTRYTICTRS